MKTNSLRWLIVYLGAAILGGACLLQTVAPADQETMLVVTATPDGGLPAGPEQPSPTFTQEPTGLSTAAFTPTATVIEVKMTAGQALSCVTGPDWKLYEWVSKIPKGETVTLIARSVPEIPDYYVARTSGGKECWAFGGSSEIRGPVDSLPVRDTPPPPTVSFVVRNKLYINLVDVFIRPAGDSSWGADRLTASAICVGLEDSISITAGYYDVRILDHFGHAVYEAYNRAIGVEDAYRILEVATDVEFTIQNGNPSDICKVEVIYVASGSTWKKLYDAADGGGPIHNGEQRQVTMRAGQYDVRITNCSNTILSTAPLYIYPGMGVIVLT